MCAVMGQFRQVPGLTPTCDVWLEIVKSLLFSSQPPEGPSKSRLWRSKNVIFILIMNEQR